MDPSNPYEAPSAALVDEKGAAGMLVPVEIEPRAILVRSWELFRRNPGTVLGAVLIPLAIAFGASFLTEIVGAVGEELGGSALVTGGLRGALEVVGWIVPIWLQLGMIRILLHVVRGSSASLDALFGEGRLLLSGIIASIAVAFGTVIGLMLLVVPGVVLALGWSLSSYAIVDQNLDPFASLGESWRLTNGYKLRLLLANVAIGLLAVLATLATCGLGGIVAFPILGLSQVVIYDSLLHRQGSRPTSPDDVEPLV